jgi:hypothetical protein
MARGLFKERRLGLPLMRKVGGAMDSSGNGALFTQPSLTSDIQANALSHPVGLFGFFLWTAGTGIGRLVL